MTMPVQLSMSHQPIRPLAGRSGARRMAFAVLSLGLLVAGCTYESAGTTTSTSLDPEQLPPATGPAAIVFRDQLVDGSAVMIDSVSLPADGFVVLQADAAGVAGEVVGVSELVGSH